MLTRRNAFQTLGAAALASHPALAADPYLAAVRTYADNVLKYGRDVYGPKPTPLFVDGVNVDTHEPVKWVPTNGKEFVLSDLGNQQLLFRVFDGLTKLTGEAGYRQAAVDATKYALANLRPNGFLAWGGHCAYNASDGAVFWSEDKGKSHELKEHYPYYQLMWEMDAAATKSVIETMWNGHILNWSNLDFNRHGTARPMGKLWKSEYTGGEVFFWGKGLTFVNAGSDLYYAAAMLAKFTGEEGPLVWAKRLAHRYVETRNEKTGIGGYQFSQMADAWCDDVGKIRGDRAQYQFAEAFPGHRVVEGTLFPTYGDVPGVYPQIVQMHLGEVLGARGAEFTQWAIEELAAWAKSAYRAADNTFIPMLTDGTSMEGFVVPKEGYFGPKGRVLKAGKARASHFWAYAMAARVSKQPAMFEMARRIALANDFGAIDGELNPRLGTAEPDALFGFLELHRASGKPMFLDAAKRVGDNMLRAHFHHGFFLRSANHLYARFDSVDALALLHLAAALAGKPAAAPPYVGTGAFFAAAYGNQGHKYDNDILYSRTRRNL